MLECYQHRSGQCSSCCQHSSCLCSSYLSASSAHVWVPINLPDFSIINLARENRKLCRYHSQTLATLIALILLYLCSTQTQTTLIILKSGKLVLKQELSWHSNMRNIGNTQTRATPVSLTDISYVDSTPH